MAQNPQQNTDQNETYTQPEETETYEQQEEELNTIYAEASAILLAFLLSLDLFNLSPIDEAKIENEVHKILLKAETKAKKWVDKVIDYAWKIGKAITLVTTGKAKNIEEAKKKVERQKESPSEKYNKNQIKETTYDDLLKMTQNTRIEVKRVIRQIVAQNMQGKELGTAAKQLRNQIIKDLREELKKSADFAIIDRAGKRWSIESYAKMVARTKIMQAQLEATISSALENKAYYAVISDHNSDHESCRQWEGKIVKLTPDAPGDYPLISDLRRRGSGIFHPQCKHHLLPFTSVDVLPRQIKERNNVIV